MVVLGVGVVVFARHLPPGGPIDVGKTRVAVDFGVDACEVESRGERQRLGVDLRTADDEHLVLTGRVGKLPGGVDAGSRFDAFGAVVGLPRDDDDPPARQRAAESTPTCAGP